MIPAFSAGCPTACGAPQRKRRRVPMSRTFRGGVHPAEQKALSANTPLRVCEPGGELVFPLAQHIGTPAKAVVRKDDRVLVGQVLGVADGGHSANVICSCSGRVKAVEKRRVFFGHLSECVVVENDRQFTPVEGLGEETDTDTLSGAEIIARIRKAGIVGLGGVGYPTHEKLQPPDPSAIRCVIGNGAECEPYLTCNDLLMRREPEAIVSGLRLLLRLFPNARGVLAIEDNKPQALSAIRKAAAGIPEIQVLSLRTKYPQGSEHNLIQAVTGITYPVAQHPADIGCLVDNVGTLYAIEQAVAHNRPLYSHILTVSGDAVREPGNLLVRDGTSLAEVLDCCGGLKEGVELKKVLSGGPMMGLALSTLNVPVQKTTNGLLLLSEDPVERAQRQQTACLHCGRCARICPMGLLPQLLAQAAEAGDYRRYEKKLYGLECISCGSCTFICPAKRPLMQLFRRTKAEIRERQRAVKAGGDAK